LHVWLGIVIVAGYGIRLVTKGSWVRLLSVPLM